MKANGSIACTAEGSNKDEISVVDWGRYALVDVEQVDVLGGAIDGERAGQGRGAGGERSYVGAGGAGLK